MNFMNKHILRAALSLCVMSLGALAHAQVSIADVELIEGCEGVVTDSGGSAAGYGPDESHSVTICPPDGEETVWIEWQVFDLDPTSTISVYDGETTFSALLAQGTNAQLAGNSYVAGIGNPTGCLTITFTSGSGADVGGDFAFSINCGQPCAVPVPVLNPTSPSPFRACPGEEIVFDGTTSFSSGSATITTWNWDWNGDETIDETTEAGVATHTYEDPGIYRVQMSLVDDAGCESIDLTNYMVHVSNEPVWGIEPLQRTACTGDEVELEIVVEGQEFVLAPSADFGDGLFIPDIVGECFTSELTFTQFIPGQTIGDASAAVEQLFMNFEHSYMGDLIISFICPNGQSIQVHDQGGTNTFLGEPVDNDADPDTPGIGYDYSWEPDANNGTWSENAGGILPAGSYESVQTFANLDGCPLNGVWQIEICDLLGSDNGFVFGWGIQFADSLYPVEQSFTPTFGLECDSTFWTNGVQDEHVVYSGQWDCADVGVTMNTPGTQTYTAHAVNNFGCEFTQNVTVDYVAFDATIEASSEIFCGVPVELEVAVAGADPADLTVEWNNSPFLSDTLGAEVTVSGMNAPQSFQANISQAYDDFPGLLCATTSSITVGTCEIIIPNVVTPYSTSGDNDNFRIPGIQSYDDVEITILNRWGTVVFESDDFGASPTWDCAADGASSGVYYYVLTIPVEEGPLVVTDINGERVEYEGNGPFTFEGMFHLMD
jgi:PKD repeat protein